MYSRPISSIIIIFKKLCPPNFTSGKRSFVAKSSVQAIFWSLSCWGYGNCRGLAVMVSLWLVLGS